MSEIISAIVQQYRQEWVDAGAPLPIAVAYDPAYEDHPARWQVAWHDSLWDGRSRCSSPIAEFTTWREAQDWAMWEACARGGVVRLGREAIVGPMPPSWVECCEMGLDHYGGPPWAPLPADAAERQRQELAASRAKWGW